MIGRALVHVPSAAKRGDVIEIKALIAHVMETGYRIGVTGQPIPRDIINDFAFRLPVTIISLLLGLPEGDHDHFREWAFDLSILWNKPAAQPESMGHLAHTPRAVREWQPLVGGGAWV